MNNCQEELVIMVMPHNVGGQFPYLKCILVSKIPRICCCSVAKLCSWWPHGLQHTSLPCPSLSPGVCSNSCPLSWWCHPTISSSITPFSCPQSFLASGSFPMSGLFTSGGHSIGASASASVLPVNNQSWFSFDWFDLLAFQGTLKSLLQHHSSLN